MDICHQIVDIDDKELGKLFACLIALVRLLRSDKGCPWDRKQTVDDVKEFLLEEVYELISALSNKDWEETQEEIGDVLLLAVFLTQIGKENEIFSLRGALEEVIDKLIRRHPHVFGDLSLSDANEVIANWTKIKEQEKKKKGKKSGPWESVPMHAPSMFQYYTYLKELKKRGKQELVREEASIKQELVSIFSKEDLTEIDLTKALANLVEICYLNGMDPEMLFLRQILKMRSQEGGA